LAAARRCQVADLVPALDEHDPATLIPKRI
jgi:hypothetical protein